MRKLILPLGLLLSTIQLSTADVYMEARMFGDVPIKTWTTPTKQRSEAEMKGSDSGMGAFLQGAQQMTGVGSFITRVDKGVVWNIQNEKKQYFELPLEEEYHGKPKIKDTDSNIEVESEDGGKDEPMGKIEVEKLPARQIAGFSATGYRILENKKPVMTIWRAPSEGVLAQAEKEIAEYNKNMLAKKFAKYPAKEREELTGAATMIGNAFMGEYGEMLKGILAIPAGFTLCAEYYEEDSKNPTVGFAVDKIEVKSIPASQFEVPAGYAKKEMPKMPDLNQMRVNPNTGEIEGIDPKQMEQAMKQMQEIFGNPGGESE